MARSEQRAAQREAPVTEEFEIFRDAGDKFYVDPKTIPDGMSYEWKRLSSLGQEDRRHQVNLARNRWVPVPAERHPEIGGDPMNPDQHGRPNPHADHIVIDGLILMERPIQITQKVQADDARLARGQVREQFERLKLVPDGTLSSEKGQRDVNIRRDRDLSIPEDAE